MNDRQRDKDDLELARAEMRRWAEDIAALAPHAGTKGSEAVDRAFVAARARFLEACAAYADLAGT